VISVILASSESRCVFRCSSSCLVRVEISVTRVARRSRRVSLFFEVVPIFSSNSCFMLSSRLYFPLTSSCTVCCLIYINFFLWKSACSASLKLRSFTKASYIRANCALSVVASSTAVLGIESLIRVTSFSLLLLLLKLMFSRG
jgi:hypothetical protein